MCKSNFVEGNRVIRSEKRETMMRMNESLGKQTVACKVDMLGSVGFHFIQS